MSIRKFLRWLLFMEPEADGRWFALIAWLFMLALMLHFLAGCAARRDPYAPIWQPVELKNSADWTYVHNGKPLGRIAALNGGGYRWYGCKDITGGTTTLQQAMNSVAQSCGFTGAE